MLLWHRETRPAAAGADAAPTPTPSADLAAYEAKRQRALQILGERWLLHRANAPDRRPASSVLARACAGQPPAAEAH